MEILKELSNQVFDIIHLTKDVDLSSFSVQKGYGLELYLKEYALRDEVNHDARTYLIVTTDTKELASYFTLRTGLITVSRGFLKGFDAYTGIELANFAVNSSYKEAHDMIPKLGSYIFSEFILPLIKYIGLYIGAAYLYIYALPEDRLMKHYKTMGFRYMSRQESKFIYRHVKPVYDQSCVFMYQKI